MLGAKVNVLGTLAVFEAVKAAGDQVKRLVYASSAAVFGAPDKYPPGPLPDDVPLVPEHALRRLQVLQRGQRPHLLPGLRPLEHRPAAVDGLRRRPRSRHDQRADQGHQGGAARPALSHQLRRLEDLQYVDDVAKTFVNCLDRPYNGAKSYNLRGAVVPIAGVPRGALSRCCRKPRSWSRSADANRHRLRPLRRRPRSAISARCRRRRSRTASAKRWRSSGSYRAKAGSTRPTSMPPSPRRSRLPMSRISLAPQPRGLPTADRFRHVSGTSCNSAGAECTVFVKS